MEQSSGESLQALSRAHEQTLRGYAERRRARNHALEQARLLEAQKRSKSPDPETREKKPVPNTFQSDHPTLTYLGQYLTFTNTPPPPPAGPIMTAALSIPPDIRFLHYEHAKGAYEKLRAYVDEIREEEERKAEEEADQEEWEDEQAELAAERRKKGRMKRGYNLRRVLAERAGTYRPWRTKSIDQTVDECYGTIEILLAKHGKDLFMQFPFEKRSDYIERMKISQEAIEEPLQQYRDEMAKQIKEWFENDDPDGEEEDREVAEGGRRWLSERAREWLDDRMVYHWSGIPVWKNQAKPPRVLARKKLVDRQAGKCYQCAAAEDDAICTRLEGLSRDCGRCLRLGLHCLVPSTQFTYDDHSWHYGEFGEGNEDPLPRYARIRRNEVYNQLPPEGDTEAWERLRGFLDRVKEEERRLRMEKRDRGLRMEWVGGERGFVVREERDRWALPRAEFEDGRLVGFERGGVGEKKNMRKGEGKKKKKVVKKGGQKMGQDGEGAEKRCGSLGKGKDESTKRATSENERHQVKDGAVEEKDTEDGEDSDGFEDATEDDEDSDEFEDAQDEPSRSLEDELRIAEKQ